jgi:DNA-binding beta-propeller fold protein YncE
MARFDEGPSYDAAEVTPNDGTIVAFRALYIGGSGDVSVVTPAGNTVLLLNANAGQVYPIMVQKVRATGTTATGIVGLK